jgi:23S rRNA (cytosine1962-C5)-methyltransferase
MDAVMTEAICSAWQRRQCLHEDPEIDTYRVFHGFSEGCVGLNIERFGDLAVVFLHNPDLKSKLEAIVDAVDACFSPSRVILKERFREGGGFHEARGRMLRGTPPMGPVEVKEAGLRFLIDPLLAPNVGLFLDARPARAWLRANGRGRRVLNLFAYTGSLGVAAAAGGARSVTHVETQWNSLRRVQENHALNGLPIDERDLVRGDLYVHLPRASRGGQRFDGIILDPPPHVPERGGRARSGQDLSTLSEICTKLLNPGAWMLCFFHRASGTRSACEEQVIAAAGAPLSVRWRGTSGEDFPEQDPERGLHLTAFEMGT